MSMVSEAHLPVAERNPGFVRYVKVAKRRSWAGWAIFVGFVILNEVRGVYVVVEFLKAWQA